MPSRPDTSTPVPDSALLSLLPTPLPAAAPGSVAAPGTGSGALLAAAASGAVSASSQAFLSVAFLAPRRASAASCGCSKGGA
jgi:streptogramin lyase